MKRALAVVALVVGLAVLPGCRNGIPDVPQGTIDCAKDTVRSQVFNVMESVARILVGIGGDNWLQVAKSETVNLVKQFGHEVVACALGYKGQQYTIAAEGNPSDAVSVEAANRAAALMHEMGYRDVRLDNR